jgi:hypothetical protein
VLWVDRASQGSCARLINGLARQDQPVACRRDLHGELTCTSGRSVVRPPTFILPAPHLRIFESIASSDFLPTIAS